MCQGCETRQRRHKWPSYLVQPQRQSVSVHSCPAVGVHVSRLPPWEVGRGKAADLGPWVRNISANTSRAPKRLRCMFGAPPLTDGNLLSKGQRDEQEGQAHRHTGHQLVQSQLGPNAAVPSLVGILQQEITEHILGSHMCNGHVHPSSEHKLVLHTNTTEEHTHAIVFLWRICRICQQPIRMAQEILEGKTAKHN